MDLESQAIQRIRLAAELSAAYYQKPLLLAYSGGKDSEVCLELCRRARVPLEVIHNLTTADAPETIYHVRKVFHQLELEGVACAFHRPRYHGNPTSMWSLIVQKGWPPTRRHRYCCQVLKEGSAPHRAVVLGVRSAESQSRRDSAVAEQWGRSRREVQRFDFDNGDKRIIAPCQQKAEIKIHPIVEWRDSDVWSFLRDSHVAVNPVYNLGFQRVGCVGCPMAGKTRYTEFRAWPAFERLYRTAFDKMLRTRWENGKFNSWHAADDVFRWWMEDHNIAGQLDLYDPKRKNLFSEETIQEVCLGLHSMCKGAESKYFNGHTNIKDDKFLVFGVKGIMELNRSLRDALLFSILSYMTNALLGAGNYVGALDELYLFLTNLTAIEYIRNLMKRDRKKDSLLVLASQNIEDFLQPGVRELTKPLFSIPTHQFLFNPGQLEPKAFCDTLQLEQAEFELIRYPERGTCLYRCGNERYLLQVHFPEFKEKMFGKAGGR